MSVQFSYTVKAKLGGTFDEDDAIEDKEAGINSAYERLWEELTELVLRGSQEEFEATFSIVVEECEELGETCHQCGANMGVWDPTFPDLQCPECHANHTMRAEEA